MVPLTEMLRALRRRESASAEELAADLGVSRPTISRLLAAAGAQVVHSGVTRGRRYSASRVVEGLGTRQPIFRITAAGEVARLGTLQFLGGGRHWVERAAGRMEAFRGLPPWASDMSPQGYVGRAFPAKHPDLRLPPRTAAWNDEHRLIAIARRGEDCAGDLILGDESLDRFLSSSIVETDPRDYSTLAVSTLRGEVGSSAAGEHPKFLVFSGGRHVIVKIYGGDESAASLRWRDLAVAEATALETVTQAGVAAARARWVDQEHFRFVEVERFDRLQARGRRGMLSLAAIDQEYFGAADSWTLAARRLEQSGDITADEAQRMLWLDVFGQLIANTDRHFGNLSFFVDDDAYALAPIYDMLPMLFAPAESVVVDRPFTPRGPTSETLSVYNSAAAAAERYWNTLAHEQAISPDFRAIASSARDAVTRAISVAPSIVR